MTPFALRLRAASSALLTGNWWQNLNPTSLVVITLVGVIAVYSLCVSGIMPIMVASWVHGLGISERTAGYIATANFAGGATGLAVAILLLSRLSVARIAALGLAIAMLGDGLCILAHGAISLGIFRYSGGCGHGLLSTAVISWFARHQQPDRCFGVFMMMQIVFFSPLMIVVPALQAIIGSAAPYIFLLGLGGISIVLRPLLNLNGGNVPLSNPEPAIAGGDGKGGSWCASAITILSVVAPTLFLIAAVGIWAYLERYGVSLGIDERWLGSALAGIVLTGVPASMMVVWLGNRFGRVIPILFGFMGIIAPIALFLLHISSITVFVLAGGVFNAAWSFVIPYFQAIQSDLDRTGRVATLANLAGSVGGAFGPVTFALMLSHGGYPAAFLVMLGIYVLALAAALAPALTVDRTKISAGEVMPFVPGL